jgi:HEPN domain-containing protein
MPPEAAQVRLWDRKAAHDRIAAELALSAAPPLSDVAAFHCQQAIEKLLRAYLVFQGRPFEKTHDLRMLALECATVDPDFETLIDRVAPISAFAVRFRYPGPGDPMIAEVDAALAVAREVSELVLVRLPPEARP